MEESQISYRKFPKTQRSSIFSVDEPLEETKFLPNFKIRFFWFFICLLFNLLILYLYYIFKIIYEGSKSIMSFGKEKKYLKMVICVFVYLADLIPSVSVVLLTIHLFWSMSSKVFYIWIILCYILFLSYMCIIAFHEAIELEGKPSWKSLTSDSYFRKMSLGLFQDLASAKLFDVEKEEEESNPLQSKHFESRRDFELRLKELMFTMNIDSTFMHYGFFCENVEPPINFAESEETMEKFGLYEEGLIYATHCGKKMMWSLYCAAREFTIKRSFSLIGKIALLLGLLFVKVGFPLYYIHRTKEKIHWNSISIIILFYSYILFIILNLLENGDLRRQKTFLETLKQLINIDNLKFPGEEPYGVTLDITCPLTLDTWDNIRRISIVLECEKTKRFEMTYSFLGIYFLFILTILLHISFKVDFLIDKKSIFHNPVLVLIMILDFYLMFALFFIRIFYGSKLNDSMKTMRDSIDSLNGLYQDLYDLQSLYFYNSLKIQNPIYRCVVGRIIEKIQHKTVETRSALQEKQVLNKSYQNIKEYIVKLKNSLKQIKSQNVYDVKIYSHHFLGFIESNFLVLLPQIFLGLLPILPTLLKIITKKVN